MSAAEQLHVISDPAAALTLLNPVRVRMLEELSQPQSAATIARAIDLPRQKVNYHLRELEKAGFVRLVEERKKGNCVERILTTTATSYIVDPTILGKLGDDPQAARDRFSLTYLVGVAARTIRDLVRLRKAADKAGKRVPTFSLEADVRFANAQARAEFTEALSNAVAKLIAKHHDESAPRGRTFTFVLGAYPKITRDIEADADAAQPETSHE